MFDSSGVKVPLTTRRILQPLPSMDMGFANIGPLARRRIPQILFGTSGATGILSN
jgi:hypothetical protein